MQYLLWAAALSPVVVFVWFVVRCLRWRTHRLLFAVTIALELLGLYGIFLPPVNGQVFHLWPPTSVEEANLLHLRILAATSVIVAAIGVPICLWLYGALSRAAGERRPGGAAQAP